MQARAEIGLENEDGTVTFIHCRCEGNPARIGSVLLEAWSERSELRNLLAMGCLARIGSDLGVAHPPHHQAFPDVEAWMRRYGDMCEFYHRDWYDGWSRQDGPWTMASVSAFTRDIAENEGVRAVYVLRKGGFWEISLKTETGMTTRRMPMNFDPVLKQVEEAAFAV